MQPLRFGQDDYWKRAWPAVPRALYEALEVACEPSVVGSLAASCMAAAVQRKAMDAERQRFTFRQTRRTVAIIFSTILVQASERRSSFGKPSRVTVRISSIPSRIEPETPDQFSFETLGEVADQLFCFVSIVQLPCLSQHSGSRS